MRVSYVDENLVYNIRASTGEPCTRVCFVLQSLLEQFTQPFVNDVERSMTEKS